MSLPVRRITAGAAVSLAALVGFSEARSTARLASGSVAACHSTVSLIAHGQGAPDDLVWYGRKLLASDIHRGTIGVVARGRVHTLVRHLREPEGIVPGPGHSLIVAEQATNRVVQVRLPSGSRTTLAKLPLPHGQSGLDGINSDGPGAVFIPDSARGRLYVLHLRSRMLSLVASGMKRPVAAINWGGAVVVADEYANTVWKIAGRRKSLAAIPLPDDLAVVSHHLIVNSLVGQVWEAAPHLGMLSSAFAPTTTDPQGMVADGPGSVIVADQEHNGIYRISRLARCL